jgi:uncharacterized membrane protein
MKAIRCAVWVVATIFLGCGPAFSQTDNVQFEAARHIVRIRCTICHTAIPQEDGLNAASQPPKGVKFDTAADIRKWAPLILEQAVKLKRMPPDNATHMSEDERAALRTWIEAGANLP